MTLSDVPRLSIGQLMSYRRLELRVEFSDDDSLAPLLSSPRRVADLCGCLAFGDSECVWWLGLDSKKRLVATAPIGLGTVNASMCPVREAVRLSLIGASVAGAIVVHNHPSGDPCPSESDREALSNLDRAMRLVGLELIDAVIVAREGYWSRLENQVTLDRR